MRSAKNKTPHARKTKEFDTVYMERFYLWESNYLSQLFNRYNILHFQLFFKPGA